MQDKARDRCSCIALTQRDGRTDSEAQPHGLALAASASPRRSTDRVVDSTTHRTNAIERPVLVQHSIPLSSRLLIPLVESYSGRRANALRDATALLLPSSSLHCMILDAKGRAQGRSRMGGMARLFAFEIYCGAHSPAKHESNNSNSLY